MSPTIWGQLFTTVGEAGEKNSAPARDMTKCGQSLMPSFVSYAMSSATTKCGIARGEVIIGGVSSVFKLNLQSLHTRIRILLLLFKVTAIFN